MSEQQHPKEHEEKNGIGKFAGLTDEQKKEFEEALAQILECQKELNGALELSSKWVEKFKEALTPILERQKEFEELLRKVSEKTKEWRDAMGVIYEAGWWFTPSLETVDLNEIQLYAEKYKNGDKRAITDLFFHIYQKNHCEYLISVVQGWKRNPYFKKWDKIIDEALDSHIRKKYSVSIPALLLVVEGIAGDYCKKEGLHEIAESSSGKSKIKGSLEKLSSKKEDELLLNEFFLKRLLSVINGRIFEHTNKLSSSLTRGYEYFLNRHAIIHGITSEYGSPQNSLQAFLILDILSLLS
jgi:hypothetical protein